MPDTIFPIDQNQMRELINIALEKGGDFADLFFEYSVYDSLSMLDGLVSKAGHHVDYGLGVRVIKDQQTGYAFTEDLAPTLMKNAARTAACIADGPSTTCPIGINHLELPDYYPIKMEWEEFDVGRRILFLQNLHNRLFEGEKRMRKVMASLSFSKTEMLYFNSEGTLCSDVRPMSALSVSCVLSSGSRTEKASASRAFRMGAEFLQPSLIEELAQEIFVRAAVLFRAEQPRGGEMNVIMGAGASGILLHEAIGHAFEADFILKDTSIFSRSLGKKICNSAISVIDDGTIPFNRGSINVDDEGTLGQKTYMVEKGVLNSFLYDRLTSRHFNLPSTGNGRRESFRYSPIPRMRATYMENGDDSLERLISTVKKGIFVDVFSNGQVQIGEGDFTFYAKTGRIIENGRLGKEIKDFNVIGNGPKALADIVAVANDGYIDNGTWTCGKGQSCPVSCGMPSVLVKSLTVGGCE